MMVLIPGVHGYQGIVLFQIADHGFEYPAFFVAVDVHPREEFELGYLVASYQIQWMQQETGRCLGDFAHEDGKPQIGSHKGHGNTRQVQQVA